MVAGGGANGEAQMSSAGSLYFLGLVVGFSLSIRDRFAFLFLCFFRFMVKTFPISIYSLE